MTSLRRAFTRVLCIIMFAGLFSAAHAAGYHKYDTKSGIVTYDVVMSMMGMNIKTQRIVYWDDYGVTECQEDYKDDGTGTMTLKDVVFEKDGIRINYSAEQRSGIKRKAVGYGVAGRYETDLTPKMKTEYKYKDLAPETILGKQCVGEFMATPYGDVNTYGWNHIMLKYDLNNEKAGMRTITTATKLEENVAIPQSKFVVPGDVGLKEM